MPLSRLRKRRTFSSGRLEAISVEGETKEIGRMARWLNNGLGGVKLKAAAFEKTRQAGAPIAEHSRVMVEQREIVHVADIGRFQDLRYKMIETVEIKIREELAGEISNWQPSSPLKGREQRVAWEMQINGFLSVGAVHDAIHEPQRPFAFNATAELCLEDFVIDGGEIPEKVTAQDVSVAVVVAFVCGDGFVGALAGTVRVAVSDESTLENRLPHGAESMMDNAIPEGRGRHQAALWFPDLDPDIPARHVTLLAQVAMESQQLAFEFAKKAAAPGFLRLPLMAFMAAACKARKLTMPS